MCPVDGRIRIPALVTSLYAVDGTGDSVADNLSLAKSWRKKWRFGRRDEIKDVRGDVVGRRAAIEFVDVGRNGVYETVKNP